MAPVSEGRGAAGSVSSRDAFGGSNLERRGTRRGAPQRALCCGRDSTIRDQHQLAPHAAELCERRGLDLAHHVAAMPFTVVSVMPMSPAICLLKRVTVPAELDRVVLRALARDPERSSAFTVAETAGSISLRALSLPRPPRWRGTAISCAELAADPGGVLPRQAGGRPALGFVAPRAQRSARHTIGNARRRVRQPSRRRGAPERVRARLFGRHLLPVHVTPSRPTSPICRRVSSRRSRQQRVPRRMCWSAGAASQAPG
jgi:hypothetical protein